MMCCRLCTPRCVTWRRISRQDCPCTQVYKLLANFSWAFFLWFHWIIIVVLNLIEPCMVQAHIILITTTKDSTVTTVAHFVSQITPIKLQSSKREFYLSLYILTVMWLSVKISSSFKHSSRCHFCGSLYYISTTSC